jgi:hypothetical protein
MRGTAEQQGQTSKLAWENQMTLDMILAEKWGYVSLLGMNVQHSSHSTQLLM